MIRIVVVLLIVFLLVAIARKLVTPAAKGKAMGGEKLVQCRYCGVYITEASAVSAGGNYFCSTDHQHRLEES
ncbi:MAG: PP0621 family protein [Gammaproteobacteria bacterium]